MDSSFHVSQAHVGFEAAPRRLRRLEDPPHLAHEPHGRRFDHEAKDPRGRWSEALRLAQNPAIQFLGLWGVVRDSGKVMAQNPTILACNTRKLA